ncbi:MAG TPA: leucyl aminopeptidase, partial [Candidatus Cybelea sp.]|nr:leucyl aminopeptidase [Candidatus Cybelea sp.]
RAPGTPPAPRKWGYEVAMKIAFVEAGLPKSGALVVGVLADNALLPSAKAVDGATNGAISRALSANRFSGKQGQVLEILAPAGLGVSRVLVYGFGKLNQVNGVGLENCAGEIVRRLAASGETSLHIACDPIRGAKLAPADAAAHLAFGARLGGYRFDKYHTKVPDDKKPSLTTVNIGVSGPGRAQRAFEPLDRIADGIFFTRDLVTEPANVIYPESLAKETKKLGKLGVKVEVLGEAEMRKLGMGALLGVGQGSERESQLVVMQWRGAAKGNQPVAFVGKGVCFDTGGISIKPAAGMEDMKWDMGGAGTVIGLMRALAGRKAKVNAVGVVGLVENMPSGTAQRPGDVVKTMSGQTVEVLNTDAEGRLVLADALWYTQDRFKPQFMVDLATLTGAIIIALGHEYAGMFSNNDRLARELEAAGKAEGEGLWRLPLADAYNKLMDSPIADIQNISNDRGAGSITAAQFLQRFVKEVPWAHLDIAGTAWSKKDKPTVPKGATAFGVRLLNRLVSDHYEGR